jgi:lipopolysaccharide transport system permease protein
MSAWWPRRNRRLEAFPGTRDQSIRGRAFAVSAMGQTVIGPSRGRLGDALREAWQSRELLYFLVWRDLKIRYKQSIIGVAWAILQPVLTMMLLTVVFGHLIHVKTSGPPYTVFVLTGLIGWQLFSYSLSHAGTSLVRDQRLITRVYFPRIFLPTASVTAAIVDFALSSVVLAGLLTYYGIVPTVALLTVPLFLLLLVATALGVGFWTAALNVQYRDVQYAMPFLTQLWFFATPIVYSSTIVPERWRLLLGANPMSGVVEGLRWAVFRQPTDIGPTVALSAAGAAVLFISGFAYFRRMERLFADVI